jgi:8-oxo-dGTP pyrophosphatase MutT (NUDIX family)
MKLGVSGIVEDECGRILLGQRSKTDKSLPGLWCTPGGGVKRGEFLHQALRREFSEEVGFDIIVGPTVTITQRLSTTNKGQINFIVFKQVRQQFPAQEARALDGFDRIRWFSRLSLVTYMWRGLVTPATIEALKIYLK